MKRVDIVFAPPSLARTLHRTGPLAWSLAVLAVLLCAAAGATGWQMLARQRALDAQLALVRAQVKAPVVVAAVQPRIGEAQAHAVNAAVLQLNLPWRALQDAVASATPSTIALIALEPDARKQVLKITAEAASSDDMVDYVSQLKQQEAFSAVALTRHDVQETDPHRPLRFQLEATWGNR